MEKTPYAVGKQINRMPIGSHRLILKSTSTKEVQSNFYLEMRDLARFYQEIEKKITRLRMDLHNCLQLTFPELEQFFSNRLTLTH